MPANTEFRDRYDLHEDTDHQVQHQDEKTSDHKALEHTVINDGRTESRLDAVLRFQDTLETLRDNPTDRNITSYTREDLNHAIDQTKEIVNGEHSFKELNTGEKRAVNDVIAAGFNNMTMHSNNYAAVDEVKHEIGYAIMQDIYPETDSLRGADNEGPTISAFQFAQWSASRYMDAAGYRDTNGYLDINRWDPSNYEANGAAMNHAVDTALQFVQKETWNQELTWGTIHDLPTEGGANGLQHKAVNAMAEHAASRLNEAVDAIQDEDTYSHKFGIVSRLIENTANIADEKLQADDRNGFDTVMNNLRADRILEHVMGDVNERNHDQDAVRADQAIHFLQNDLANASTNEHPLNDFNRTATGIMEQITRFQESIPGASEFRDGIEFLAAAMNTELQKLEHITEVVRDYITGGKETDMDQEIARDISRAASPNLRSIEQLAQAAQGYLPAGAIN